MLPMLRTSIGVLLGACLLALPLVARADGPIPLRDFFRNAERDSYQISPDGKTLAFLGPYRNRRNQGLGPSV
jgi:hypothetical protein